MTEKHFDIAARRAKHASREQSANEKLNAYWESDFSEFHNARELIYCAIISIHYRYVVRSDSLKNDKVQLTLTIMSFIKGMNLTQLAISSGLYAQANNLLKQEMETLTACIEMRLGKRKDRKTPNTQHLPYGLKSIYGKLNDVAHVSYSKALLFVNLSIEEDNSSSASSTPQYNIKMAKGLYGLHIVMMHEMALEMIQGFAPKVKAREIKEELEILAKSFKIIQSLEILSGDGVTKL